MQSNGQGRSFYPAVLLACGFGLWAVFGESAATSHSSARASFLAVPAGLFLIAFMAAGGTKGRPPWLEICAAAACLGWLLTFASCFFSGLN
jgi:hypothetical protein